MPISNAPAVCFALFVFAGYYKAADSLQFVPVDLTLLFAAGTVAFCVIEVWRTRALSAGMVPMLAVFLAMAIGFHWPEQIASYAVQKELRLFTITALSALAPLVLLRTGDRRQAFGYTVCLLGLIMAGIAVFEAASYGFSQRATVFNANPILLARVSGFAVLFLCLLYWQGLYNFWAFAAATLIALMGLLVSGTKGPLLGLLLTIFVIVPFFFVYGASRRRVWGTLAAGSVAFTAALVILNWVGVYFARRIAGALTGERGFAGETRLTLWRQTLELIQEHPFGLGWGRFNEWIHVYENGKLLRHPHNIALEIFIEAGWLAGAAFLALVITSLYFSLRMLYRASAGSGGAAAPDLLLVPAGLLYWLLCAAFSGDVNDNRPLWALLGMTLAALASSRMAKPDRLKGAVELGDR